MASATKGKCSLCGGVYGKQAMTRHIQACLEANPTPLVGRGKERVAQLLRVVVQSPGIPAYWLHLEAPADAPLASLDSFLRKTWLECCGHMSAFTIDKQQYVSAAEGPWEKGMSTTLGKVVSIGTAFKYEYDFGSTTELKLTVADEREGEAKGKAVRLLARNEAPPLCCTPCGKDAASICTECSEEENHWLCEGCSAAHEGHEDFLLPVVNSPRVGVCAYAG